MLDELANKDTGPFSGPQIRAALERLERLVVDGLKHGFFEYSIACEIANGGKRQLVIRAAKSHKFTIPEHEVPL
jgi:hypothetical protein